MPVDRSHEQNAASSWLKQKETFMESWIAERFQRTSTLEGNLGEDFSRLSTPVNLGEKEGSVTPDSPFFVLFEM